MASVASIPVEPSADLLPAAEFARLVGSMEGKASPRLRQLFVECDPGAELTEQLTALEKLGRFVVAGPAMHTAGNDGLARLQLLVEALERVPAARARFRAVVKSVLSQTRAIKVFGEIGLPNARGLLHETTDRLARRFLPEAPAPHELYMLVGRIVRRNEDLKWLGPAADSLLHRLADVGGDCWEPLRASVVDAISMITTRIAALGMAEAFRTRTNKSGVRDSPLYHLQRARPEEMPALIEASKRHLEQVKVALEERGVSIDVVYALDSIERGLHRIELLLPFADPDDSLEPTTEIRKVIEAVGLGLVGNRSFSQLMSDNLRLLARKVIERAGRTGEHYVTSSRKEWFKMLGSAAGGGFLTLGTAVIKFFIKWQHFAPFLDGLFSSIDYAASFVIMQLLGFTLATKQPSMTAASLAGVIRDKEGPGQLDELVRLISRIARSQFAAALGNVSAVILAATLFDLVMQRAYGHSFLPEKDAIKTIESFDPLGSGTIFYAALTGVILWISSLIAGWFENWIVYRRLPEAIEHHRAGKRLGKDRMARWARFLERQASGFGGSISLGFMLGMLQPIASFFGLPLEVRHITLSTGSLTLSMQSAGLDAVGWGPFISACAGIACMGILNFGVSFALALIVALRARDVPRGERRTLPFAVFKRFLRSPLQFFFPPKDDPNAPPPAHHH